jgi:putative protease
MLLNRQMEILVGKIIHYYKELGVASVRLEDVLDMGALIHVVGHTTDFEQKVESMEIMHQRVVRAGEGQVVGLKVTDYVRDNDLIYRISI